MHQHGDPVLGFQDWVSFGVFSWFFLEGFAYENGQRSDGKKKKPDEEGLKEEEGRRRRLTKKKSAGAGSQKRNGLTRPTF